MARRSGNSNWSRPATGRQIAALKAHGNYDGKYFSAGRASQTIGRSLGSKTARSSYTPRPSSRRLSGVGSLDSLAYDLVLGEIDSYVDDLFSSIDTDDPLNPASGQPSSDLASVAFTVTPDESEPAQPRFTFTAQVEHDPAHVGAPTFEVHFRSNVQFGEPKPGTPDGFNSGVIFDG